MILYATFVACAVAVAPPKPCNYIALPQSFNIDEACFVAGWKAAHEYGIRHPDWVIVGVECDTRPHDGGRE